MKTILVLKGGGAKGLLQVSCLAELEKQGVDLVNTDLKVGTSVGAINAAILARDITANNLLDLYPKLIDKVFKKKWLLSSPKYDRNNFKEAWNDIFGTLTAKMKDLNRNLIITSVDRREDKPHFFKSWEKKDGEEYIVDIICRSFAAPLFFGQINDPFNQKVWIDGGCGIDNLPLEYAFIEILLAGWLDNNEPVKIICVGTGYSEKIKSYKDVANDGAFNQLRDFFNLPEGGMARNMSSWAQIDRIVKLCSKYTNINFLYYDIEIPKAADGMDKLKYKDEYIKWGIEAAKHPCIQCKCC